MHETGCPAIQLGFEYCTCSANINAQMPELPSITRRASASQIEAFLAQLTSLPSSVTRSHGGFLPPAGNFAPGTVVQQPGQRCGTCWHAPCICSFEPKHTQCHLCHGQIIRDLSQPNARFYQCANVYCSMRKLIWDGYRYVAV